MISQFPRFPSPILLLIIIISSLSNRGYAIDGEERHGLGVLPQQHSKGLRFEIGQQRAVNAVLQQLHSLLKLLRKHEVPTHLAHHARLRLTPLLRFHVILHSLLRCVRHDPLKQLGVPLSRAVPQQKLVGQIVRPRFPQSLRRVVQELHRQIVALLHVPQQQRVDRRLSEMQLVETVAQFAQMGVAEHLLPRIQHPQRRIPAGIRALEGLHDLVDEVFAALEVFEDHVHVLRLLRFQKQVDESGAGDSVRTNAGQFHDLVDLQGAFPAPALVVPVNEDVVGPHGGLEAVLADQIEELFGLGEGFRFHVALHQCLEVHHFRGVALAQHHLPEALSHLGGVCAETASADRELVIVDADVGEFLAHLEDDFKGSLEPSVFKKNVEHLRVTSELAIARNEHTYSNPSRKTLSYCG